MPLNCLHILDNPMDSELEIIDMIACNFVEEVYSSLASSDETDPLDPARASACPEAESR